MDATKTFYLETLGLERSRESTGDDGVYNFFVTGDGTAEMQFKYHEDRDVTVDRSQVDHLAIEVADTDATVERLVSAGSEVVREPFTHESGRRIAFITDPTGYVLELIQPAT
jgi:lactoylglutathione lyase